MFDMTIHWVSHEGAVHKPPANIHPPPQKREVNTPVQDRQKSALSAKWKCQFGVMHVLKSLDKHRFIMINAISHSRPTASLSNRQARMLSNTTRPKRSCSFVPCPSVKSRLIVRVCSEVGGAGGAGPGGRGTGGDGGGGDGEGGGQQFWLHVLVILGAGGAVAVLLMVYDPPSTEPALPQNAAVSVIVPALNEAKCITEALRHLHGLQPPPVQVIVVDGGSFDGTRKLARRAGAKVVTSQRGRARQMNAGAAAAQGDVLMFVHADSRPPLNAVSEARAALADSRVVLGGFTTAIKHEGRVLWFTTIHQFVSTYYAPLLFAPVGFFSGLRCMFGDQSLFCRASDFKRAGGFNAALAIMEDTDLCHRMHRRGRADGRRGREVQLRAVNSTSGRRVAMMGGNLRTTAVHFQLALAWWCGAAPEELWRMYERLYPDTCR